MAQGPQQFTPSQILEAGRRAENEGRVEYAIQFYRHLTDHLARTPEAAVARDALTRLGAATVAATAPNPAATSHPAPENGHYYNGSGGPFHGPAAAAAPSTGPMQARPAPAPGAGGALIVRQPANGAASHAQDAAARRRLLVPRSRRRYRTGRFVARAFTVIGFAVITVGTVVLGASLLARSATIAGVLPDLIAAQQLIGTAAGVSLILLGMVQVLGGQLARAIFDTASTNRDLVAYSRARATFDAGLGDEPPPAG